jgi:glycosyltransferase involved in cell wall biosynthesis
MRLRLAQFINHFSVGGGERQFIELVKGLGAAHSVEVCAVDSSGPLLASVQALGLQPHAFPLQGSFVHPGTVFQVTRLARFLRQREVQLLHAHDFYSSLLAVPAARLAGCRVVVSRLDLVHWHGRWRHLALAAASRGADHVVANAEAVRRFVFDREGIPSGRISVIHNGMDLEAFDQRQVQPPSSPLPKTGDAPVAVLVGNMHYPVKRQEDLLGALVLARRTFPALQAFLVGEGARRPFLEREAARLGLSSVVHFLGQRDDVPAIWKRATVGVLCSEREGLSNAIIEGMASRLPMVVTDAGGNAELVEDGVRGRVVDVRRPAELAAALISVLAEPLRAQQMGKAGRAFVEERLTLGRMVAAHAELYQALLGTGVAARAA